MSLNETERGLVSAAVSLSASVESICHAMQCMAEIRKDGTSEECRAMAYAMRDEFATNAVNLHRLGNAFSKAAVAVQKMIDEGER